jgi:FMN phosphatase YigB (HAD superfamily)
LITRAHGNDWVHVGSGWDRDVAPAAALGVPSVWLDRSPRAGIAAPALAHVYSGVEALSAIEQLLEAAETCAT